MTVCPKCGRWLGPAARICPTCGEVEGRSISSGYHVTKEKDLPRILAEGLIPQVGPRTKTSLPIEPYDYAAVMLWPTLSDAEEFKQLLEFHEGGKCVILEVKNVGKYGHKVVKKPWTGSMSTEIHVLERIPASEISVLRSEEGADEEEAKLSSIEAKYPQLLNTPDPAYVTHGTSIQNALSILREGKLISGINMERVSFSLDQTIWHEDVNVFIVFPFIALKDDLIPVFYVNTYAFTIEIDGYAYCRFDAISFVEVESREGLEFPVSLATQILIKNPNKELEDLALKRGLTVVRTFETRFSKWAEDARHFMIDLFIVGTTTPDIETIRLPEFVKRYNEKIARIFGIDLSKAMKEIEKREKEI